MTKNIHPLAHAFLEASRDFHNMTDFAAAFRAWDAARDAWCDAGFPIDEAQTTQVKCTVRLATMETFERTVVRVTGRHIFVDRGGGDVVAYSRKTGLRYGYKTGSHIENHEAVVAEWIRANGGVS